MGKAGQYHSALHDSDNKYHIYSDCPQGNNIKNRCRCTEVQPEELCEWCEGKQG